LATSAVYVRGPIDALGNPASRGAAVLASTRDSLVRCLLSPPSSRAESTVFESAKAAYTGSPTERFGGVESLRDVALAMPFLVPAWEARVHAAETIDELGRLQRDLDRAPMASARRGARAKVLLLALDEASETRGPTELDGELAHAVRIELVDLRATKVLLRLRRRVDPSWISVPRHAEYASGMDGCRLAMDVQMSVVP
jgi:hypothetical protein